MNQLLSCKGHLFGAIEMVEHNNNLLVMIQLHPFLQTGYQHCYSPHCLKSPDYIVEGITE